MKDRLISADKLLEWIEENHNATGFWEGDPHTAFDELTDAIELGILDSDRPHEIKRGDPVRIVKTIYKGVIADIQYVHNRYQLRGVSGWQYGIDRLANDTGENGGSET
ncbi:hypothetical protein [Paenibacillus tyrfis]|uniref:hypothetical protein n=1 Tax=Paenibacillus tyrfis TaxID=1501230 RepID=UPI000B58ED84|nr:hypothetical protein [Paenibacillus tyrfis]